MYSEIFSSKPLKGLRMETGEYWPFLGILGGSISISGRPVNKKNNGKTTEADPAAMEAVGSGLSCGI